MRKRFELIIHVSAWLIYFLFNYVYLKNNRVEFNLLFHAKTWIIQILLFYINYYLLIPYLFLKRKLISYLGLSLITLSGMYYIKTTIDDNFFRDRRPLMIEPKREDFFIPIPPNEMELKPMHEPHNFRFPKGPAPDQPGRPFVPFNFFAITGLLLIYTASFSIRLFQKWRDDEKQKDNIEKDKISTELNFLKQQINPHFLFNSLNSIYSLSMTKSQYTTDAILKLSSILRYILYEGEKQNVRLADELETLKNYIDLQKLRITPKVKVNYEINGKFEDLRIEPLLLLPLIENAFKHGVDNVNDSYIDIRIIIEENTMEVYIKNKRFKLKKQNIKEEGGIGIKNIQRRLDLIYPNLHVFTVNEENGIFSVYLKLKLR